MSTPLTILHNGHRKVIRIGANDNMSTLLLVSPFSLRNGTANLGLLPGRDLYEIKRLTLNSDSSEELTRQKLIRYWYFSHSTRGFQMNPTRICVWFEFAGNQSAERGAQLVYTQIPCSLVLNYYCYLLFLVLIPPCNRYLQDSHYYHQTREQAIAPHAYR